VKPGRHSLNLSHASLLGSQILELAKPSLDEVRVGIVEKSHGRDEDHGGVTASRQQYAIGVEAELKRIANVGGPLIAASKTVRPGTSFAE
jgi:hypothetical protein